METKLLYTLKDCLFIKKCLKDNIKIINKYKLIFNTTDDDWIELDIL